LSTLESIIKKAKRNLRRIVLSEGEDSRVVAAAIKAKSTGLAWPILIGRTRLIKSTIQNSGFDPNEFEIIDPNTSDKLETYSSEYCSLRKNRKISMDEALEKVKLPLNFSCMMVRLGHADGTIGGAISTTSETIGAALKVIGRAENATTVSSFFFNNSRPTLSH
jgi:phosphate acetyltransferase